MTDNEQGLDAAILGAIDTTQPDLENQTQETEQTQNLESKQPEAKQDATPTQDWEKQYKSLQPEYTKNQQRLKDFESRYKDVDPDDYKTTKSYMKALEEAYAKDPEVKKALNKHLGIQDQDNYEYTDDPLYKYSLEKNKELMGEIQRLKEMVNPIVESSRSQKANETLSKEEDSVKSFYKDTFGKDISKEDMNKVHSYMFQNKIYNGETVAKTLFYKEATEALVQKALQDQMGKKNKSSTVPTSAPQGSKDSSQKGVSNVILDALAKQGWH